jgi:hypothetical protein
MKRLLLVTILTTFLFSVSCSSLSGEAGGKAQRFWAERFTKCGDSYYGVIFDAVSLTKRICEYKNVNFSVTADKLTEADKLNGVEWQGRAYMKWTLIRCFGEPLKEGQWTKWQDGRSDASYKVFLQRKGGEWVFGEMYSPILGENINCSNLPQ